jgi:iron complex outermembrane recepter protein
VKDLLNQQKSFMKLLFFFLLMTSFLGAHAQVSGIVKDDQGNTLAGTTVSLIKAEDSSVVKLSVTNDKGNYAFEKVAPGNYRIMASFLGHKNYYSEAFTHENFDVVVNVALEKAPSEMKGVVVTAKKPIVEVKADKTILNVEGTINAIGSDALDLLRKSPGVTVDKDENLSLSGKNGVKVFIDGRPTPLTGQDLAQFLKSLQSSNIEAIEMITNPSAKYEAAGNAGIINIRLKKNKSLGTNGSVNAGYAVGSYSKYNTGFTFNHRNNSLNFFGNYNYSNNHGLNELIIDRTVADSHFVTKNKVLPVNNTHNFKAGVDYFINKQNTIGAIVSGSINNTKIGNSSQTTIANKFDQVDRILRANNSSALENDNVNLNLNYSYTNPKGRSLNINADHGSFQLTNDQYQPNFYYDATGTVLERKVVYQMLAPSDISISSAKGDWEQNFMKGKLGFGGKIAFIKSDNDFRRFNVLETGKELDKDRSNVFNYKENINAVYANYNRTFNGFMIQAGLRMENTITEGASTGLRLDNGNYKEYDSTFKRNYTDLFPSASITFNKNPMSTYSLTYSRRIDRPAYQDLNPFEFKLDEYTFRKGNIELQPQYTNSIGLTHTYKYKLNTTLNFSKVENMFVQWIDTAETTKSFITNKNLATQKIVSLNVSYPLQYKSYSLFANLNANYSKYKADFGPGREVDMEAAGFTFYAQNSLRFANTWTAELSGFYNAPSIYQGSFKGESLWAIGLGLQKQLFENKATVKLSVSDIFNTLNFTGSTDFVGQKTTFNSRWESQQLKLSLSFRFGNNGVKAARNRGTGAEEEAKRVQQGGGVGIGN